VSYWENGLRHRPASQGPAFQNWDEAGKNIKAAYYENGKEIK
jgi:hypothetical protein